MRCRAIFVSSAIGLLMTGHCSSFQSGVSGGIDSPDSAPNDAGAEGLPPIGGDPQQDVDAADGAAKPRCNPKKPWGTPVVVPELSSALNDEVTLTRDELIAFFGPFGIGNTRVAKRPTRSATFTPTSGTELSAVNASSAQGVGSVNADGTALYVQDYDAGNYSLRASSRQNTTDPFSVPSSVIVGGKAAVDAFAPHISLDGQTLYGIDILTLRLWQAARTDDPRHFGPRQEVFTSADVPATGLPSADGLTLYLTDPSGAEIYVVTRAGAMLPFTDTPVRVDILNVTGKSSSPEWISEDDCVLYLTSNRGGPGAKGGSDIFVSTRGQ